MMYVCVYVCAYVRNTIASEWSIRLTRNLVWTLQVAVEQTLLIFVNVGHIVLFYFILQERKEEFLYITPSGVKLLQVI